MALNFQKKSIKTLNNINKNSTCYVSKTYLNDKVNIFKPDFYTRFELGLYNCVCFTFTLYTLYKDKKNCYER